MLSYYERCFQNFAQSAYFDSFDSFISSIHVCILHCGCWVPYDLSRTLNAVLAYHTLHRYPLMRLIPVTGGEKEVQMLDLYIGSVGSNVVFGDHDTLFRTFFCICELKVKIMKAV